MTDVEQVLHDLDVEKMKLAVEKTAGFWRGITSSLTTTSMGRALGDTLTAALPAAGVAAAGVAGAAGFNVLRSRLAKGRAFKQMVETHPELKKQDAKAVQRTFNTIYNLNPQLAKDPLVAGGFVRRSMTKADVGEGAGAYVDLNTARELQRGGMGVAPVLDTFLSAAQSQAKGRGWVPPTKEEACGMKAYEAGLKPERWGPSSKRESKEMIDYQASRGPNKWAPSSKREAEAFETFKAQLRKP